MTAGSTSSAIRLQLRQRPHLDFVIGYPGLALDEPLNASSSDPHQQLQQACLEGTVEVRVSNPVHAQWLKVELKKTETVQTSKGVRRYFELIGSKELILWQGIGKEFADKDGFAPLDTSDHQFKIPIPPGLPPSILLDKSKGTGVVYHLVASAFIKVKTKSIFGSSNGNHFKTPQTISQISEVAVEKHELNPAWPVYSWQAEQTPLEVRQANVTMRLKRETVIFGSSDPMNFTIDIASERNAPIKITRIELQLREVITSREADASAKGGTIDPKKKLQQVNEVAMLRSTVHNLLYQGESMSHNLSSTYPAQHSHFTVQNAKHLEVKYLIRLRAIIEVPKEAKPKKGEKKAKEEPIKEIILDNIPLIVSPWSKKHGEWWKVKIGKIPKNLQRPMSPPAAPNGQQHQQQQQQNQQVPPVGSSSSPLPQQNGQAQTASPYLATSSPPPGNSQYRGNVGPSASSSHSSLRQAGQSHPNHTMFSGQATSPPRSPSSQSPANSPAAQAARTFNERVQQGNAKIAAANLQPYPSHGLPQSPSSTSLPESGVALAPTQSWTQLSQPTNSPHQINGSQPNLSHSVPNNVPVSQAMSVERSREAAIQHGRRLSSFPPPPPGQQLAAHNSSQEELVSTSSRQQQQNQHIPLRLTQSESGHNTFIYRPNGNMPSLDSAFLRSSPPPKPYQMDGSYPSISRSPSLNQPISTPPDRAQLRSPQAQHRRIMSDGAQSMHTFNPAPYRHSPSASSPSQAASRNFERLEQPVQQQPQPIPQQQQQQSLALPASPPMAQGRRDSLVHHNRREEPADVPSNNAGLTYLPTFAAEEEEDLPHNAQEHAEREDSITPLDYRRMSNPIVSALPFNGSNGGKGRRDSLPPSIRPNGSGSRRMHIETTQGGFPTRKNTLSTITGSPPSSQQSSPVYEIPSPATPLAALSYSPQPQQPQPDLQISQPVDDEPHRWESAVNEKERLYNEAKERARITQERAGNVRRSPTGSAEMDSSTNSSGETRNGYANEQVYKSVEDRVPTPLNLMRSFSHPGPSRPPSGDGYRSQNVDGLLTPTEANHRHSMASTTLGYLASHSADGHTNDQRRHSYASEHTPQNEVAEPDYRPNGTTDNCATPQGFDTNSSNRNALNPLNSSAPASSSARQWSMSAIASPSTAGPNGAGNTSLDPQKLAYLRALAAREAYQQRMLGKQPEPLSAWEEKRRLQQLYDEENQAAKGLNEETGTYDTPQGQPGFDEYPSEQDHRDVSPPNNFPAQTPTSVYLTPDTTYGGNSQANRRHSYFGSPNSSSNHLPRSMSNHTSEQSHSTTGSHNYIRDPGISKGKQRRYSSYGDENNDLYENLEDSLEDHQPYNNVSGYGQTTLPPARPPKGREVILDQFKYLDTPVSPSAAEYQRRLLLGRQSDSSHYGH